MSYLADLNGKVRDYGLVPLEGATVSVYRKVGEGITDSNGNYSDIEQDEYSQYIVELSKDDYHTEYREFPLNGKLNANLSKIDPTKPDVPTLFRANDFDTGDSIMLLWSETLFEYVAGYNIYRSNDFRGPFQQVNSGLINDTTYLDTGLEPGVSYYYILEVVSANSKCYRQGKTSRTSIIGPVIIEPHIVESDITLESSIKVDSTKVGREGNKAVDGNKNTWWESNRASGAWIESQFDDYKHISRFYFKKRSVSRGISFAVLQYYNDEKWVDIQNVNYLVTIDHMFTGFLVRTKRIRLYVSQTEPLTEAEISELKVYGE